MSTLTLDQANRIIAAILARGDKKVSGE